jgi:mersacidin/lichenicidin family type 2 lantibiotic
MKPEQIIRAWKDEKYRRSLSDAERAQLPENPAGIIELSDAMLESVAGAGGKSASTGALCYVTKSKECTTITKTSICDFTKTCGDITKGCTVYFP